MSIDSIEHKIKNFGAKIKELIKNTPKKQVNKSEKEHDYLRRQDISDLKQIISTHKKEKGIN